MKSLPTEDNFQPLFLNSTNSSMISTWIMTELFLNMRWANSLSTSY
jgi:hypothetical protein